MASIHGHAGADQIHGRGTEQQGAEQQGTKLGFSLQRPGWSMPSSGMTNVEIILAFAGNRLWGGEREPC